MTKSVLSVLFTSPAVAAVFGVCMETGWLAVPATQDRWHSPRNPVEAPRIPQMRGVS